MILLFLATMWRAERLRLFARNARGGQLRESAPVVSQVDEDGVTDECLSLFPEIPSLPHDREEEVIGSEGGRSPHEVSFCCGQDLASLNVSGNTLIS